MITLGPKPLPIMANRETTKGTDTTGSGADHSKHEGYNTSSRATHNKLVGACNGMRGPIYNYTWDTASRSNFADVSIRPTELGRDVIRSSMISTRRPEFTLPLSLMAKKNAEKLKSSKTTEEVVRREAASDRKLHSLFLGQWSEKMRGRMENCMRPQVISKTKDQLMRPQKISKTKDQLELLKHVHGASVHLAGNRFTLLMIPQAKQRYYTLRQHRGLAIKDQFRQEKTFENIKSHTQQANVFGRMVDGSGASIYDEEV